MSLRFWQRIRLAPGVTLNLSKSTASLSFGPRGAKYTISPRGNRATVGLPGTGLFYTVHDHGRTTAPKPRGAARDTLTLGFFRRLVTPADERDFVDGLRLLNDGETEAALERLESARALPDAAWMAGVLRLRANEMVQARDHFEAALSGAGAGAGALGKLFAKYEVAAQASLPVAAGVFAHILPRERGTRLALVEIAQASGDRAAALAHLERLRALAPDDPVVLLSWVEAVMPEGPGGGASGPRAQIIALTATVANDTPVDTALLLYRARALAAEGAPDAAIEVLTRAGRRRKDRPAALLHQIRHDRAALYDRVGRKAQGRREFERLFAEAPGFPGLAERLGLPASPR